jgi:sugar phosphate isomerase/epimerase
MLHSVSYAGTWGQAALTLDQFLAKAADLGFDGVELMAKRPHLSPLDYDATRRRGLRASIEKRDFRRVCVAAYNNFAADSEHRDIPHQEIQIHYLTELARLTADIGGDLLRIFTAYEIGSTGFAAQWQFTVDCIKELSRRAAEFGVIIGVQNHHDIGVGFESHHALIEAVNEPNCKAMFDAWAPALHGADLAAAATKMAPLTTHTTTANYRALPRYQYQGALTNYKEAAAWMQAVPMDEGVIDYTAFLNALRAGGFTGSIAYEMCSPLRDGGSIETLDRYAEKFVEFIEGWRA